LLETEKQHSNNEHGSKQTSARNSDDATVYEQTEMPTLSDVPHQTTNEHKPAAAVSGRHLDVKPS
jgi:hypothetical protein